MGLGAVQPPQLLQYDKDYKGEQHNTQVPLHSQEYIFFSSQRRKKQNKKANAIKMPSNLLKSYVVIPHVRKILG